MRKALASLLLALAAPPAFAQAWLTLGPLMLGMPRAQVLERMPLLNCQGNRCHVLVPLACGHLRPGAEREGCTKPFLIAGVEPTLWSLEFMDGRLASIYITLPARHFDKVAAALAFQYGAPTEQRPAAAKAAESRRLAWEDATGVLIAVDRAGGSDVTALSLSTRSHAELQRKRDKPAAGS
ncbi:MAG TPA: hypothetical protein VM489_04605 [Burkholderiales bacterium]|nr:hypothetical protein [Burkholderiales bacterium]